MSLAAQSGRSDRGVPVPLRPDPAVPTERPLMPNPEAPPHRPWVRALPRTPLTPRELIVLALSGYGLTYKEVGAYMGIKENTVRGLAEAAYYRLQVSDRTAAFRKLGWLQIPIELSIQAAAVIRRRT